MATISKWEMVERLLLCCSTISYIDFIDSSLSDHISLSNIRISSFPLLSYHRHSAPLLSLHKIWYMPLTTIKTMMDWNPLFLVSPFLVSTLMPLIKMRMFSRQIKDFYPYNSRKNSLKHAIITPLQKASPRLLA